MVRPVRSQPRGARACCATPDAPWLTYALTSTAVGATAIAGALAADPGNAWYLDLAKPSWQPPRRAFGVIWPPLYASIAWADGHALRRSSGRERTALITSLAAILALYAAWNWMFFGLRSPRAGLVRPKPMAGSSAVSA